MTTLTSSEIAATPSAPLEQVLTRYERSRTRLSDARMFSSSSTTRTSGLLLFSAVLAWPSEGVRRAARKSSSSLKGITISIPQRPTSLSTPFATRGAVPYPGQSQAKSRKIQVKPGRRAGRGGEMVGAPRKAIRRRARRRRGRRSHVLREPRAQDTRDPLGERQRQRGTKPAAAGSCYRTPPWRASTASSPSSTGRGPTS